MSENPPEKPAPDAPPAPPAPPPAPPQPLPVPAPPESGASSEVLDAIKQLTETVGKLANRDAGLPNDQTPVKRPWTHWGSK